MSILPHHHHHHHLQHAATIGRHHHHHRNHRVYCTATNPSNTSPKPKKLVINVAPPKTDDPSLKSTWAHRAWVAAGSTTLLHTLANSITGSIESHIWVQPILSGFAGYFFADLLTGIYHWGIDNYGDASTPFIGRQADMALGHHKWPWTITKRQVANNIHVLAGGVTVTLLPIDLVCGHDQPVAMAFLGVVGGCVMFSQQFHAWAHGTKSKLPPVVAALQDAGVLLSSSHHAGHHNPPIKNYCIVSGIWDGFLDKHRVYEALEMAVFQKFGLRPRSWSEPTPDFVEEVEVASPP